MPHEPHDSEDFDYPLKTESVQRKYRMWKNWEFRDYFISLPHLKCLEKPYTTED